MRPLLLVLTSLAAACSPALDGDNLDSNLTSAAGDELTIAYDGFVYVAPGATDDAIQGVIARQIKSSLGALRERGIGVLDRDARSNLDPSSWIRTPVLVIDEAGDETGDLLRVTYRYRDTAIVEEDRVPNGPIALPLLFGDYGSRYDDLVPACTDDSDPYAELSRTGSSTKPGSRRARTATA